MGPLPAVRLEPYLPTFTNIGVDYFGTLYVSLDVELKNDTDVCSRAW